MGLLLGIQTDTGETIPDCSRSDLLMHQLLIFPSRGSPLTKLAEHFRLNLDPLTGDKIVGKEGETLEDFVSRDPDDKDRPKYWYQFEAQREAAWQSPQTILSAVLSLIKALDTPNVFLDLEIEDPYFTSGGFREAAMLMVKALDWCNENKIKKVRMYIE